MAPKADFVKLFMPIQGDLLAYILAMGIREADANDVLQDSASIMLSKIGQFESGTNFRAWAFAIVKREILTAQRARSRRPLSLSAPAVDDIERLAMSDSEIPTLRFKALNVCMGKLQERAKELVRLRYKEGMNAASIAETLKRPVDAIYTTLSRIRKTLQECISRFERTEGHPA
ncbi:MAG: sigma-70 family RNA polymerase sigma factor [Planctomycetota bacterium]|jgi:RNA polymerase sigma-70 factor (ECF subfamily)